MIGHCGLLRKKTRIMVTSETKFLEQTDYIIVMKNQVNEPLMSDNDDVMSLQLLLIGGESCVLIRCLIV